MIDIENAEVGEYYNLIHPEHYKGYRRVEIVEFYGRDILVRTESGWEFTVREHELEER